MLIVNPVNFLSVTRKEIYIINPQHIIHHAGDKQSFNLRLHCSLHAQRLKLNDIGGQSYLEFVCIDPQHGYRFCADKKNPLIVTHLQLEVTKRASGNLLVQVYTESCHACGEVNTHCWREYTGHYLCPVCVTAGRRAPYSYGTTTKKCCVDNNCGEALHFYSEVPEMLYERVLGIYERYSAR